MQIRLNSYNNSKFKSITANNNTFCSIKLLDISNWKCKPGDVVRMLRFRIIKFSIRRVLYDEYNEKFSDYSIFSFHSKTVGVSES